MTIHTPIKVDYLEAGSSGPLVVLVHSAIFGVRMWLRLMDDLKGHVWTVPAVQEEFDYQRSVRVRSCIRPVVAWRITSVAMQPLWPLALM